MITSLGSEIDGLVQKDVTPLYVFLYQLIKTGELWLLEEQLFKIYFSYIF